MIPPRPWHLLPAIAAVCAMFVGAITLTDVAYFVGTFAIIPSVLFAIHVEEKRSELAPAAEEDRKLLEEAEREVEMFLACEVPEPPKPLPPAHCSICHLSMRLCHEDMTTLGLKLWRARHARMKSLAVKRPAATSIPGPGMRRMG